MSNKARVLTVLRELQNKTDEDNFLTINDLKDVIYQTYGEEVDRKTIYDDFEILRQAGFDIELKREGNNFGYYLASNILDKTELRILADLLVSTNFITNKKTKEMVDKLLGQTSEYNRKAILKTVNYLHHKGSNEKIYYNVDAIQTALEKHKAITFNYFDIDEKGKKAYRQHDYHCIPYALVINDGRYYTIVYTEKHSGFTNYRLDKMDNIEIVDTKHQRVKFDINEKMSSMFNMYSGEEKEVKLRCGSKLSMEVLDQFTKNMTITKSDENYFEVSAKISIAPTFYGWLFQYNDTITVLGPKEVIKNYQIYLNKEIRKYEGIK